MNNGKAAPKRIAVCLLSERRIYQASFIGVSARRQADAALLQVVASMTAAIAVKYRHTFHRMLILSLYSNTHDASHVIMKSRNEERPISNCSTDSLDAASVHHTRPH